MNPRVLYNEIGARINGLWYRIDTTNACGLSCPTCARAKFVTPKGFMKLETFKAIIDKALSEFGIRILELYAWGDSMLNPNLHEYCEYAVSKGIKTTISSNLNTIKCDLEKVLMSGISTVFVSFSGWAKYHITHRGGDIKVVEKNMKYLASLPKHPNTRIVMRYHIYKHNGGEEQERARALCKEYGWDINAYGAQWMENASIVHKALNEEDKKIWEMLLWKPNEKRSSFCYYQTKSILIDANGNTYLCCVTPYGDEFKTGSYLDMDLSEIRNNMKNHPFCISCKASGLNNYQLGRGGV